MNKIKTRFLVVLLNVLISIGYLIFILIYIDTTRSNEQDFIENILYTYESVAFIIIYNFINVLWVAFIIYGGISKKQEVIMGGVYALILSVIIFTITLTAYFMLLNSH